MKLPQVMGLVFCKRFDPLTFSLENLFQGLHFRMFPAMADPFTVYAAVYSTGAEGTIELTCSRLETESDVYRLQMWRALPAAHVVQLPFPVPRLRFPAPGRYVFKLSFDGTELGHRYLEIIREVSTP